MSPQAYSLEQDDLSGLLAAEPNISKCNIRMCGIRSSHDFEKLTRQLIGIACVAYKASMV